MYLWGMDKNVKLQADFWQNVSALMHARWGKENLTRLAKEARLGPATVVRIKGMETSVTIGTVAAIADVFGVRPWHLLAPGLDPADLPADIPMRASQAAAYHAIIQAARSNPAAH